MRISETKTGFTPITLTIHIESDMELKTLWARLNACNDDVVKAGKSVNLKHGPHLECCDFYEAVDGLVEERKYKE
jgi:hypothetical protein